jgi:hypothetical protein
MIRYGLRCPCHGARLYDSHAQRDAHAITFQCKQEWFRVEQSKQSQP